MLQCLLTTHCCINASRVSVLWLSHPSTLWKQSESYETPPHSFHFKCDDPNFDGQHKAKPKVPNI